MIPEPQWDKVLQKALEKKKIIILGEVDSGKSTFAKFLIKNLVKYCPVCFIDSDVGQSTISIPTTLAVKVFDENYNFAKEDEILIDFDKLFFFGATTPTVDLEEFIKEFSKAVEFSKSLNCKVLVDTTGLISGEVGKHLKLRKIKTLEPDLVIIFEKKDEMRHIVNEIENETLVIKPSLNVKPRNPLLRAEYRKKKFSEYFKNSDSFMIERKLIKTEIKGKIEGRPIGLYKNEDCLALGIVEELSKDSLLFFAPSWIDLMQINKIKIGYVDLSKEGVLS